MSLSTRHKRRLKELSRMIESTIIVRDEMVEINLEYAKEIEEFIALIENKQPQKDISVSASEDPSSIVILNEKMPSDSSENKESTGEHQTASNYEEIKVHDNEAPAWAKYLWKKIALKCHPDRLNFLELTSIEIAKRQMMFSQAREVYNSQNWQKLLYYGITLDEYVDDLSMADQYMMLEAQYNNAAEKVTAVQSSLAWKWGTDWKNLHVRIQIITVCCQNKGITPPSRENLMTMLIKFESE